MGNTSTSSRFSIFCRFCWQTLAVFLIIFALGVSLIRGLLPQLDHVRQHVVSYIKSEYQIQVDIGKLSAEWQAFGPSLMVNDLVIPAQDNLPLQLTISKVKLKLDFWDTLLTLSPQIEDVTFKDIHADLNIDKLSNSEKQSIIQDKQHQQIDWLYRLLLEQLDRFSITDVTLQLLSVNHHYRPIHIKNLHWLNTSGRHQGQGLLFLDQQASKHELLKLNIDVKGNGNRPDSIFGQIYVAAKDLDLGEWASRQPHPYQNQATLPLEGIINLQAWFSFEKRAINSALVQFSPSYLEWQFKQQPQRFSIQSGQLEWKATSVGWQAYSHDLQLQTNGKPWPDPKLYFSYEQGKLFTYLDQLLPQNLFPLLPVIPGVNPTQLLTWHALSPKGIIGPIKFYDTPSTSPQVDIDVDKLQWQPTGMIPGISAFHGQFAWKQNKLHFALPNQPLTLDYGQHLFKPVTFDQSTLLGWWDNDSSALYIPRLNLENADLSLNAKTKLTLKDSAFLSLAADAKIKNASNIYLYYPITAMGNDLVEYLKDALKKGQSHDAKIVWNGTLNQFPYQNNSGVFQAGFSMEKSEFAFQHDWPAITDLSLQALFENNRMDLWIKQGQLLKINTANAHVYIPEMGDKSLLSVDAKLNTTGEHATQVLNQSPLADSVGSVLNTLEVQGNIASRLNLDIPLYHGAHEDIQGSIKLKQVKVNVHQPGILLTKVSGNVQFHNTDVSSQDLTGQLYDQAFNLSFNTKEESNSTKLNLKIDSIWNLNTLPPNLANPFSGYYDGQFKWHGKLAMSFDHSGYSLHAKVNSNLQNVALTLPTPFTKKPRHIMPLSAELIGDNKTIHLGVKLGEKAEFWGGFNEASGKNFAFYDLILGRQFETGDQIKKQDGHLWLDMARTDLNQWLPIIQGCLIHYPHSANKNTNLVQNNITPQDSTEASLFPPLRGIEGHIDNLILFNQNWHNLTIKAAPTEHAWRFAGIANEFDGHMDFYPNWYTQGVKLVASRLYLSPNKTDEKAIPSRQHKPKVNQLPPLAIDVDDFRFKNKKLGHLTFQGTPENSGYNIQTLSFNSPGINLVSKGHWRNQYTQNTTELNIKLTANKFNHLAQRLDIDPGVKDSSLDLNADISWQGSPLDFALSTLNGKVTFQLGKGHLSQISDKGARIFSLFSLDSLLRKLSLDFSDVFGKGLYFNSFNGTLNIDNGVVKTTDTEMDAVAGNMKVRGYTDLSTESLNYDIRFVPQLASSVPTVVLLSTSAWTMGLGAFALTKVLEPMIEIISEIRFRLTGTMSNPHLEEISRKSKEIEIPQSILPQNQQQQNSTNTLDTLKDISQ